MSKKLPFVTSNIPRDLRMFLDRMRELVSGSGGDRLISLNDLTSSGLAVSDSSGNLVGPAQPFLSIPPAPTDVTATAAIRNIIVEWDTPNYSGHAYAEVWGASTNSLGASSLLGMSPGGIYVDETGPSTTRFYWVRFVNTNNVKGPYNAVSGASATTASDLAYTMDVLSDAFGSTSQAPFFQLDSPQVINGVTIPAGTYMKSAYIYDGVITNAKIGNLAVDSAKIANLSVATAKIQDLAITNAKIANLSVTSAKIQDLAVTNAKLGFAAVKNANIDLLAVDTAEIADAAIKSAKIDDLAVTTLKIGDRAVTVPIVTQNPEQIIRSFIVDYLFASCGTLSSRPGYYVSIQGVDPGTDVFVQVTFPDQNELYNSSSPSGIYPLLKYRLLRFHYDIAGNLKTTYNVTSLGEVQITGNGATLANWVVGPGLYNVGGVGVRNVSLSRVFTYVDDSPTVAEADIFVYFFNGWADDQSQGAGGLITARCAAFTTFVLAAKK